MPLLNLMMVALVSNAPETAQWIPAASPEILRPLSTTFSASRVSSIDWLNLASGIYLLVAGLLFARLIAGLVRSWGLWKRSTPLKESWAAGADIRVSTQLGTPATFGSTILLPSDWPEWNAFKRNAVLLHEQSHVRRRDFYIHLLSGLYRAAFWFNPLSWWLHRHLLELAELTCDDDALRHVEDRVSYAEILLDFTKRGSQSGFIGVAMARGRTVERRIERILTERYIPMKPSLLRGILLAGAVIPLTALAAGIWILQAEAISTSPARMLSLQPAQAPQTTEPRRGLAAWIKEEVPDIATDEETSAFHNLRTDEERLQFISSFWLRRDPTPGTPANELRDEYYRRITVANRRFTSPVQPGFRTDRGRILIKFGEPDEVETHAQGVTNPGLGPTPPFERWRYRFLEGFGSNVILEFVDSDRSGNYRLTYDRAEEGKLLSKTKP